MNRDKVRGMFFGIAIGDALGMPVETMSGDEIKKLCGRVTEYRKAARDHRLSPDRAAGRWTDDTQLTLVMAESLIRSGCIDHDDIAQEHVKALKEDDFGWGSTTREAIERIRDGVSRHEAAIKDNPKRGAGNGVSMKISPIAAYFCAKKTFNMEDFPFMLNSVRAISEMTHSLDVSFASSYSHVIALMGCLKSYENIPFNLNSLAREFPFFVTVAAEQAEAFVEDYNSKDKVSTRMALLEERPWEYVDNVRLAEMFGGGGCYVYDSLPFTYAFFLKNPKSIESLYDVVSAGGDTDTTGSILGGMLGAINGMSIFPQHLIDGLWRKDEILDVADRFCDKFGIE